MSCDLSDIRAFTCRISADIWAGYNVAKSHPVDMYQRTKWFTNLIGITYRSQQCEMLSCISDKGVTPMAIFRLLFSITCSTVVLQCYRRQAIPMEQAKIRPSVTLYSMDRSLPNLVRLITSATPSQRPILVKFGWVGNSPQTGEI